MRLILGMHRSGTSLVARIAALAGADLGDPETFHPADRWNPDGYFEQRDVLDVNIRLVNGAFGRLSYLLLPSPERVRRRADALAGEIGRLAERYVGHVVKENRFCLTLHAWRALGLDVERALVVVRDPRAVARSLWRRDRVPSRLALHLWREHLERALASTADLPRRILWYDRLVTDDAGLRSECAALAWLLDRPEDLLVNLARDVVRLGGREPRSDLTGEVPSAVAELYRELTSRAEATA